MEKMANAGLLTIKKTERPRKTYFVTLTSLGSAIAADVKRADDRMKGILPDGDTVKD